MGAKCGTCGSNCGGCSHWPTVFRMNLAGTKKIDSPEPWDVAEGMVIGDHMVTVRVHWKSRSISFDRVELRKGIPL